MNEKGYSLSIKDRMGTGEYNEFLASGNALIHAYEEGKRLHSTVLDAKGGTLVDFERTINFLEIVKKNGIEYHELDENLRKAIEYFGLQEFFGGVAGTDSFDPGKTEIVVPGSEQKTGGDFPAQKGTSLLGKMKNLFRR